MRISKKVKDALAVVSLTVIPTLLVWLPFFLRLKTFWSIPLPQDGMATIVANYDGPLYIVAAKTLYNPQMIKELFEFPLPAEYYAAHFPLFPLLIRFFSFVMGYPYAMLAVTLLSSVLAIYYFKLLISRYVSKESVLFLTAAFAVFPARWLIVRSVGSPEPLFLATIIASIYYFQKKKYWLATIWGCLAVITKSPGILLFVAYGLKIILPQIKRLGSKSSQAWLKSLKVKEWPVFIIPLSLLLVFAFYKVRLGDFFAYFHSGDNIHLFFPPFQVFNYSAPWVGTFWLEEVVYIYLFGILGLLKLVQKKYTLLAWFVGVFLTTIFFVSHRDVARYSLPILPFLFVAFSDTLEKKEFKIAMAILIVPIYLFSLAYLSQNVMPISNWTPFLR